MELHEQVEQVKTKEDLADFVLALESDLAAKPERWENPTLDSFLSAMESWIRDMNQYYKNTGHTPVDQPTWKTFADILMAATIYE